MKALSKLLKADNIFMLNGMKIQTDLSVIWRYVRHKRAYHVSARSGVTSLKLVLISNFGDTSRTKIISFDFV